MLILRNIIDYSIKTYIAIDPLNIGTSTYKGLAHAIWLYMNLQKVSMMLPIYPSVGVVSSIPTVAGGASSGLLTNVPDKSILENLFLSMPTAPIPLLDPYTYNLIFQHIGTWLNSPPLPAIINPSVSLPSTVLTGLGVITFPAMATLGIPCWATLIGLGVSGQFPLDPYNLQQNSYEILSNFIYLGLSSNFIAPIPTIGTAIPSTGAYTGTTFPLWLFLDVPDFPVGTGDATESLEELGLSDISDETLSEKEEEGFEYITPIPSPCDIVFTNDQYVCPVGCTDEFFIGVCTSGGSPLISATDILESAQINKINNDYQDTYSTSADDIIIPTAQIEYVESSIINIEVLRPIVKTEFNVAPLGIQDAFQTSKG